MKVPFLLGVQRQADVLRFGCGAGGNVFTFLMEYEILFQEALKELAERAGIELPDQEYSESEKRVAGSEKSDSGGPTSWPPNIVCVSAAHRGRAQRLEISGQTGSFRRRRSGISAWDIRRNTGRPVPVSEKQDLRMNCPGSRGSSLWTRKNGVYDKFWNRVMFPHHGCGQPGHRFRGRVMGDASKYLENRRRRRPFDKAGTCTA